MATQTMNASDTVNGANAAEGMAGVSGTSVIASGSGRDRIARMAWRKIWYVVGVILTCLLGMFVIMSLIAIMDAKVFGGGYSTLNAMGMVRPLTCFTPMIWHITMFTPLTCHGVSRRRFAWCSVIVSLVVAAGAAALAMMFFGLTNLIRADLGVGFSMGGAEIYGGNSAASWVTITLGGLAQLLAVSALGQAAGSLVAKGWGPFLLALFFVMVVGGFGGRIWNDVAPDSLGMVSTIVQGRFHWDWGFGYQVWAPLGLAALLFAAATWLAFHLTRSRDERAARELHIG